MKTDRSKSIPIELFPSPEEKYPNTFRIIGNCKKIILFTLVFVCGMCRLIFIPIATFKHMPYFLEEIANTGRLGLAVWILTILLALLAFIGLHTEGQFNGCFFILVSCIPALAIMEHVYIIIMLTYWSRFQEVTGNNDVCKAFLVYIITTLISSSLFILIMCFQLTVNCLTERPRPL